MQRTQFKFSFSSLFTFRSGTLKFDGWARSFPQATEILQQDVILRVHFGQNVPKEMKRNPLFGFRMFCSYRAYARLDSFSSEKTSFRLIK